MVRIGVIFTVAVGVVVMMAAMAGAAKRVEMRDACDSVTFNDHFGAGACQDVGGDVTVEEFLSSNVLPEGHPAWTNEPSYLRIKTGERGKVTNKGGEPHTFTEVAAFGGGFIPEVTIRQDQRR